MSGREEGEGGMEGGRVVSSYLGNVAVGAGVTEDGMRPLRVAQDTSYVPPSRAQALGKEGREEKREWRIFESFRVVRRGREGREGGDGGREGGLTSTTARRSSTSWS